MPETKGKLTICDRCGYEHFRKFIARGDADGGYTTYDKYEDLPETWLYITQIGYLCPTCSGIFRAFIKAFLNGEPAANWTVRPEDEASHGHMMTMLGLYDLLGKESE